MAGIGIRIRFIWVMYSCLAGVVASRARWRFGTFAVGLWMAIELKKNHVPALGDVPFQLLV